MLTTTYPRHPRDPIGAFIRGQARALAAQGCTVRVFVPHDPDVEAPRIKSSEGVEVHRFHYWVPHRWEKLCQGAGIPENWRRNRLVALQVPTLVGAFVTRALPYVRQADIVHGHWSFAGAAAIALSKLTRTPSVVSMYGAEVLAPILRPVNRVLAHQAGCVIAISEFTRDRLAETVPDVSPSIIAFGVNEEKIAEPGFSRGAFRAENGISPDEHIVLSVGRLVERKGFHVLIDAAKHVPSDLPVRILIGGMGPQHEALQAQIAAAGLEDRVQMLGFIDDDDLTSWYVAADVFVLPAVADSMGDTEGLGMVLLESMANGTPVIASDIGGITDIVRHEETGLLTAPGDAEALGETITRLLCDETLQERLKVGGREHMQRNFSWDVIGKELVGFYERVRGQR